VKNWLFWLCLCVGLWVGLKPNVLPIAIGMGWLNLKFFRAVAKKLKHEAVGCRVCKKSACWSVFVTVFLMSNGQV